MSGHIRVLTFWQWQKIFPFRLCPLYHYWWTIVIWDSFPGYHTTCRNNVSLHCDGWIESLTKRIINGTRIAFKEHLKLLRKMIYFQSVSKTHFSLIIILQMKGRLLSVIVQIYNGRQAPRIHHLLVSGNGEARERIPGRRCHLKK